jgi:peptidoglycan/LPS O-acetylase OafA/YrhL
MKTIQRFTALDGLRGLAALIVLIRHTPEFWSFTVFRSYLAVDLFFLLSGFVIAYAYDDKLRDKAILLKEFFLLRVIRLYPVFFLSLFISGLVLGVKVFVKQEFPYSINTVLSSIFLTGLLVPYKLPNHHTIFPLNPPYWSLFFELIVNMVYAFFRPVLKLDHLKYYISGFALSVFLFGLAKGNLDLGCVWSFLDFAGGLSRALFGIFFGLFLYKNIDGISKKLSKLLNPFLFLFLIIVVLVSPDFGRFNPFVDAFSLLAVFPLGVVAISKMKESKFDILFTVLGSASYPLYVLHFPLARIAAFVTHHQKAQYAPFSGVVFASVLIILSYFLERYMDAPFRKWLFVQLKQKKIKTFILGPLKALQ